MRIKELLESSRNNPAYQAGYADGKRGEQDRRASAKFGPEFKDYTRGYYDGLEAGEKEREQEQQQLAARLAPYKKMTADELKKERKRILDKKDEILDLLAQARGYDLNPAKGYDEKREAIIKKYGNPEKMISQIHLIDYELSQKDVAESATAGGTSAGSIASVANPVSAHYKPKKKGKYGAPEAPQKKNRDGTAKNALDVDNNIMGGKPIKR